MFINDIETIYPLNTYPSHFVTAKHNFPTLRFEKASSAHEAAKEMVTLAEEGFVEKGMHFDAAWQEMLNHATNRVSGRGNEEGEMTKFVEIISILFVKFGY